MAIGKRALSAALCLILISSIAVPAGAFVDRSERDPALSEVTDWSHDAPPTHQHGVAALLLRQAADTQSTHPPASAQRLDLDIGSRSETTPNHQGIRIDSTILDQIQSPLAQRSPQESQYHPAIANHSRATSLLRGYADKSPRLDQRLNTSTRLLLSGDQQLVATQIQQARHNLNRWEATLSPTQSQRVKSQINRAEALLESTQSQITADSTAAVLDDRATKFDQLSEARTLAIDADDTVTQLAPVSITIDSRGDPIRNGSSTVTRNITGTVQGADPSDIETVEITVNNNQTVEANVTQANSSRFSATVQLSQRVNTISATVTTTPSGPGPGPRAGPGATQDPGVGSTRAVVSTAPDAVEREFLNPDSTAVTVEFNQQQPLAVRELRVNSTASDTLSRIQIAQFNSNPVSATPPGKFVTAIDPVLRETSDIVSSPARIQFELDNSQLSDTSADELDLVRYNQTTQNWRRVSANFTVEQPSDVGTDTTIIRATVNSVGGLLALTAGGTAVSNSQSQSQTQSRSTTDGASPTESDSSPMPEQSPQTEAQPESATPATDPQSEGGILRSLFDSIRSVFEGVIGTLERVNPLGTVSAAPSSTVSMTLNGPEGPVGPEQVRNGSITESTVLFLDGDGLTDTFEVQEVGTDPLTPRSNLSGANNSLVDGVKDPDGDTLLNTIESGAGTDPRGRDTDGDLLTDAQETQFERFNATNNDSNDDGTIDGAGDPDGDGVRTTDELRNNTNPFTPDTDGDGLTDGEELNGINGPPSDPLERDSDDDGLADLDERNLGTIPTNNDTDGDGTVDGNETFTTATNTTLPTGGNASVDITGDGNVAGDVTISDGSLSTLNTSAVQEAQSSSIVEFESDANFSTANLTLEYDNSTVSNESELAVYRRNQTTNTFRPLNSTVNTTTQTVTATTDKFSRFAVFEVPEWESNFEAIEPPNVGGQSIAPVDAAFILDSSGSMGSNDPQNLRLQAAKEFTGALLDIDRASVIDFDSDAQVKQSLTSDFRAVNNSIDTIDSFGGTNIGAGVSASNTEFQQNSSDTRAKIAVLLTDGQGQGGISEAQQAATQNVTIFTIGLSQSADANKLQQIADETGGNFTQVNRAGQLPDIFSRIANTTQSDDADGDGLTNAQEIGGFRIKGGDTSVTTVRTDPFDPDTDGDGIPDGVEAGTETTETVDVNVAGSGVSGLDKTFERTVFEAQSNPVKVDSDNDGLSDAAERDVYTVRFTDSSSDTELFKQETAVSSNPDLNLADVQSTLTEIQVSPDPLSADTDGDEVPDNVEIEAGTNPRDKDTDGDNIDDLNETSADLPNSDPTLFDQRKPEITINSIKITTVNDQEGNPLDVFDTKYTVEFSVEDAAGVSSVTVKRGDDSEEIDIDGGKNVTKTASVVAESFLAQAGQLALGKRIQIKATDTNGNSGEFVSKTTPGAYSGLVKTVAKFTPTRIGTNLIVTLFGLIRGVADTVLGVALSLFDFLKDLVFNFTDQISDLIEGFSTFLEAAFQSPVGLIKSFFGTYQADMRDANPFSVSLLPPGTDNVADALSQKSGQIAAAGGLGAIMLPIGGTAAGTTAALAAILSNHATFAAGYYAGVIVASFVLIKFIAAKAASALSSVASAISAKLSGIGSGISNIASSSGKISRATTAVKSASLVAKKGAVSVRSSVLSGIEKLPGASPGGLVDTGSLTELGDVATLSRFERTAEEVQGLPADDVARGTALVGATKRVTLLSTTDSLQTSLAGARSELRSSPEVDESSSRFVSQYLAMTGQDGLDTIQTLTSNSAVAGLLNPSVSERAKRVVTRNLNSGSITEAEATVALSEISSSSLTPAERENLSRLTGAGGSAGVKYLSVEGSKSATSTLADIRQDSDAEFDEFSRLIRESGGQNVSQVSTPVILDVLSIENAAAAGARDNLIEATASGEISSAEATQFVSSIQSSSAKQRNQRINEVAFASNTTETSQVVDETIQSN